MNEQTALATQSNQPGFLAPVVAVKDALIAYQAKKDLIDGIMRQGVDYGAVPGTTKPTLLKAGAEKATSFFGLRPVFKDAGIVEDWTGEHHNGEPFFYYRRTCNLYKGDVLVASVDGSCNSWEKKYRYRNGERVCPNCGKQTIIKGQDKYGGGWLCFAKKGGCGAKFGDNDPAIVGQVVGQVKNPDIADVVNTILKMADKRALVAATLIATGLSEYFTQDVEDYIDGVVTESEPTPTPTPAPERKAPMPRPEQPAKPAATLTPSLSEQHRQLWTAANKAGLIDGVTVKIWAIRANDDEATIQEKIKMLSDAINASESEPNDYAHEGMADPRTGDGENR